MAIRQGVDWIEPDLCITKDGYLVIVHDLELGTQLSELITLHEAELGTVTDIATRPEFSGKNRTVTMSNGRVFSGWIVSDFTLAEVNNKPLYFLLTCQ